jgi:hypothetical protein
MNGGRSFAMSIVSDMRETAMLYNFDYVFYCSISQC